MKRLIVTSLCALCLFIGLSRAEYTSMPAFVTSVFGRIGAIVAQAGDYAAFYLKLPGYTTSVIYAADAPFNVVADGSTDNTAAMRAVAIACATINTASGATGGKVVLPPGGILVNGNIPFTNACHIDGGGPGGGLSAPDYGGTLIWQQCLACDTLSFVTLNGVTLTNFGIQYGNGHEGTGAAISIRASSVPVANANYRSYINNLKIWGGNYGIFCFGCSDFSFTNNQILNFASVGIARPTDSLGVDSGDSIISGNVIWGINRTGDACIKFDPAGAVHVIGNKLLVCNSGVWLNVSQGPTGTMIVADNSIEGFTSGAVVVTQGAPGKSFGFISVHDNQMQAHSAPIVSAVTVSVGAAQYIDQITVHDNIINISGTIASMSCVNIQDGNHVQVHHNNCNLNSTASSFAYYVTGNAANVHLDQNIAYGFTTSKYILDVSTLITDTTRPTLTFTGVPTTNVANGSQFWISDADPATSPCTHAGAQTGSMAFRQNNAWKCF